MFECDCCGCCCRNIGLSPIYAYLDRGDGVCKYLNENICSIYSERPLLCRVDECYERFFKGQMTLEEYYKINKEECAKLKALENRKE